MKIKFIAIFLILCIASAAIAATLTTSSFPLEGKGSDRGETTVGNLLADALRDAVGTDLAFVNASQIRPVDLPAGAITEAQVDSILAYPDDSIAIVQLKGSKVKAFLERGLGMAPQPNKGFLQVSGLTVRFDSSKAEGARVVDVRVAGNALDTNRTYKVAMPGSLARGSGGYFNVLNGSPVQVQNKTLEVTVNGYLRDHGTPSAKADMPRIQDVKKAEE
jgi:5'-nucleotidase / UDP-sugar diphosphatase